MLFRATRLRILQATLCTLLLAQLSGAPAFAAATSTTSLAVMSGVPFTTFPVQGEMVSGTQVAVTFAAVSSVTGNAVAQARGDGRGLVFTISAPDGGTVILKMAGVVGFTEATRAIVRVLDAAGAAVATCDTTTVSFSLGTNGTVIVPPECQVPGVQVTVNTGFSAIGPFPNDERYFQQTGFRIDNQTIWDYFNRRGGVATFGYPVSRTFLFQGFPVQFFQRRIVQISHNGQARLLNVLDPGLLPYRSFNFATFPEFDSTLTATAPASTDVIATLAFVRVHAPDEFQGRPVDYYQTFLKTVPFSAAFPNGGDPNLLPGLDLEIWGIPTSAPTTDPNNQNVVYLRFQRGIMAYDASCGCTRGVLLADYLKSVITGSNLPPDLAQEAQTSPLFEQYDATGTQPNWIRNPAVLPNTDLNNAFFHEGYP